jgi:hypothetical protein
MAYLFCRYWHLADDLVSITLGKLAIGDGPRITTEQMGGRSGGRLGRMAA